MGQQARKDPRAKVLSMTVRYRSATLGEFIEHHSYDVSRGGMFIKTSSPFPSGTLLKFEVKIAEEQRVLQGVGRVVWKREADGATEDEPAGMGIKFIKIDEASRSVIERLVDSRGAETESAYDRPPEQNGPKMFPDSPAGGQPAPEDRTVMKPARELLEDALRKAGEVESRSSEAGGPSSKPFDSERVEPRSLSAGAEKTGGAAAGGRPAKDLDSDDEFPVPARGAEVSAARLRATSSPSAKGGAKKASTSEEEGGGARAVFLLLVVVAAAVAVFLLTKAGQEAPPKAEPEPPKTAAPLVTAPPVEAEPEATDAERAEAEAAEAEAAEAEAAEQLREAPAPPEAPAAPEPPPKAATPPVPKKPRPRPAPTTTEPTSTMPPSGSSTPEQAPTAPVVPSTPLPSPPAPAPSAPASDPGPTDSPTGAN